MTPAERLAWLEERKHAPIQRQRRGPGEPLVEAWFVRRTFRVSSGCWLWLGSLHRSGYGMTVLKANGDDVERTWKVHRLAFATLVGSIGNHHVLHSCDEPACCNPAHLSIGDNRINVAQRVSRGRSAKRYGTSNRNARIGAKERALIDESVSAGISRSQLARVLGVCRATVEAHASNRRAP